VQERVVICSQHGFGDAPSKAYTAVIYLRVTITKGSLVKFVASNSRVAPCERIAYWTAHIYLENVLQKSELRKGQTAKEKPHPLCSKVWKNHEVIAEKGHPFTRQVDGSRYCSRRTLRIKEIQKSFSKNPKFDIWKKQFCNFTNH
ncbi:hypothetical protein pdam_00021741, partial [Pocillopora damicornis]